MRLRLSDALRPQEEDGTYAAIDSGSILKNSARTKVSSVTFVIASMNAGFWAWTSLVLILNIDRVGSPNRVRIQRMRYNLLVR